MYTDWMVWNMTNGEEWRVKAESIEDFISSEINPWIQLDSKYDMLECKWYFYFREVNTNRIFRVNQKK